MDLFTIEKTAAHTSRIKTPFGVSMFLVHGTKRALLIDTGMGVGDLRSFIEANTSLPFDVVVTHGHCDHAGGASQFDTVYLPEEDILLEHTHAAIEHRIFDVFHAPFGTPEGISEKDFVPQRTAPYIPYHEDLTFDLGDVHVSFVQVSGHTHGCMVPLIHEDGIMIIGDALGENTLLHFPESTSVQNYQKSIEKLLAVKENYPLLLRFHGTGASDPSILEDMHELCSDIMAHKDAAVPAQMMGYKGCWGREKEHPGKHGNLIYDPNKLYKETI